MTSMSRTVPAPPKLRRGARPAVIIAVRLRHRADRLRPALGARLLPHADVAGERLGPRRVRASRFALQNLLWGIGQPFAGAVADRFGPVRVL